MDNSLLQARHNNTILTCPSKAHRRAAFQARACSGGHAQMNMLVKPCCLTYARYASRISWYTSVRRATPARAESICAGTTTLKSCSYTTFQFLP